MRPTVIYVGQLSGLLVGGVARRRPRRALAAGRTGLSDGHDPGAIEHYGLVPSQPLCRSSLLAPWAFATVMWPARYPPTQRLHGSFYKTSLCRLRAQAAACRTDSGTPWWATTSGMTAGATGQTLQNGVVSHVHNGDIHYDNSISIHPATDKDTVSVVKSYQNSWGRAQSMASSPGFQGNPDG